MVPSTLVGLLLFAVLLGPGYVYVRRLEQIKPAYNESVFRETVAIVAASIACNFAALAVFYIIRITLPHLTPDVGELVRGSDAYIRDEYALVGAYGFGTYVMAVMIAFLAGHPAVRTSKLARAKWIRKWIRKATGQPSVVGQSAWTKLFVSEPECAKRVACRLNDGSWVDGWLLSWNPKPEEDDERTLILHAPIRFRGPKGKFPKYLSGTQYSMISAHQITRLDLFYVDKSLVADFDDAYTVE